jgi:hypothetical protein
VIGLRGKEIPLIARLSTISAVNPDRVLDGLIIFQIQEPGPQAKPLALSGPKSTQLVDDLLYNLLDGLVPAEARVIEAEPSLEGESFIQIGTKLYLRTTRGLLWPAPGARVSGPGGLSVFEMPAVPSVLLNEADDIKTIILKGVETEQNTAYEVKP